MSDEQKRSGVIEKIRALLAKTTQAGATEAEAMAAADKAGELMELYRVEMSDIEIRAEPVIRVEVQSANSSRRAPADIAVSGIAAYTGTKCWFMTGKYHHRQAVFFGLEADATFAKYLYQMIGHAIASSVKQFQKTDDYTFSFDKRATTQSYTIGMASRIRNRLVEASRQHQDIKTATGTALVIVKNAVVEDAFRQLDLHFRSSRNSALRARDGAAFNAGRAAGDAVRFDRPIGASTRTALR